MIARDCHRRATRLGLGLIAVLLAFHGGQEVSAQGTLDASFLRALEAVQRDPADPQVSFAFVRTAIATGNVRPAIARLESLLVRNPALANLRLELGLLYLETGSPQLAQRFIRQAMQDPSAPAAVRRRAEEALRESAFRQRRWSAGGEVTVGLRGETNTTAAPGGAAVQFVSGGQELPAVLRYRGHRAGGRLLRRDVDGRPRRRSRHAGGRPPARLRALLRLALFFREAARHRLLFRRHRPRAPARRAARRPCLRPALCRGGARALGRAQLEYGGGLDLRLVPGERTSARTILDARWTDYHPTVVDPLNDRRDAVLLSLGSIVGYQLLPDLFMTRSAEIARNAADVATRATGRPRRASS